jgi:hypothetical protein
MFGSSGSGRISIPTSYRNDQLQIDRPWTELNICSFFDQPRNFGRGFRFFDHWNARVQQNDRRSRVVATVKKSRKAREVIETSNPISCAYFGPAAAVIS